MGSTNFEDLLKLFNEGWRAYCGGIPISLNGTIIFPTAPHSSPQTQLIVVEKSVSSDPICETVDNPWYSLEMVEKDFYEKRIIYAPPGKDIFTSDLIWRRLIRNVLEQSLAILKSSQDPIVFLYFEVGILSKELNLSIEPNPKKKHWRQIRPSQWIPKTQPAIA